MMMEEKVKRLLGDLCRLYDRSEDQDEILTSAFIGGISSCLVLLGMDWNDLRQQGYLENRPISQLRLKLLRDLLPELSKGSG